MVKEIVALVTPVTCNSISKKQDESLNVRIDYTYQGPAKTGRLGVVVTQVVGPLEFDEIGSTRKEVSINLSEALTPETLRTDILGMPLAGCEPKSGYGIKVYALDLDGKPEWGCKNVLTITSVIPEPELTVSGLYLT